MAKIICTKKDTGKRLLIDTILEPNYKELYNEESGVEFTKEYSDVIGQAKAHPKFKKFSDEAKKKLANEVKAPKVSPKKKLSKKSK